MTAEDARFITKQSRLNMRSSQIERVLSIIKEAAKNGKFSFTLYEPIYEETRKHLIMRDFKLGVSGYPEDFTEISWKN